MSELQRHIEANEVEEARHAEAGEAEMAQHVSNARSLPELQAEVAVTHNKARRATAVRDGIFATLVLLALIMSAYTLVNRNNESRENGRRIDELTVKLDAAQALLLAEGADDEAILDCQAKFDALLRRTSFEPLASIGDLVVIISTVVPGPEREIAVADNITELGARIDETRQAIAQLAEWNNQPNKLPCPIA